MATKSTERYKNGFYTQTARIKGLGQRQYGTSSVGCPTADPSFSYRGEDVVQTLERVCRKIEYPRAIRFDNGSEFISRDLDLWAYPKDVTLDFSRPGKLTDNGFIEAFNSKLRAECLNAHWFMSFADARSKLEDRRMH